MRNQVLGSKLIGLEQFKNGASESSGVSGQRSQLNLNS